MKEYSVDPPVLYIFFWVGNDNICRLKFRNQLPILYIHIILIEVIISTLDDNLIETYCFMNF